MRNLAAVLIMATLMAACSSVPAQYVSPGDPVLSVCQQPAIQDIGNDQQAVDNANATDPGLNSGSGGQMMTQAQETDLVKDAASLRQYAGEAGSHPAFATALLDEAQEFSVAASAADNLTTNSVAIAVDKYAGEIASQCGSFRVGAAPAASKPGPGIWDWGLFWAVLGGYAIMIFTSSYLIAISERSFPRKKRMSGRGIMMMSLLWPVFLLGCAVNAYSQALESAKTTSAEKHDDRMNELSETISKLQADNDLLRAKQDGKLGG